MSLEDENFTQNVYMINNNSVTSEDQGLPEYVQ